jgi:hypothetical protein
LTDGNGSMIPVGYFSNQDDAKKALKTTSGVQGVGHGEIREIQIHESIEDYLSKNPKRK